MSRDRQHKPEARAQTVAPAANLSPVAAANHPLLSLQRTAGNQAVLDLVQAVRSSAGGSTFRATVPDETDTPSVRTDPAERQADELGGRIANDLPRVPLAAGRLPESVGEAATRHLGVDLAGAELEEAAPGERDELAVAEGDRVRFRPGLLSAMTPGGRALLGHELTHVAQQRRTGTRARQPLTVRVPDMRLFGGTDRTLPISPELLILPFPLIGDQYPIGPAVFTYISWLKLSAWAALLLRVGAIWLRGIELRGSVGTTAVTLGASATLSLPLALTLRIPVLGSLVNEWRYEDAGPPPVHLVAAQQVGLLGSFWGTRATVYRPSVDVDFSLSPFSVPPFTPKLTRLRSYQELDLGILLEAMLFGTGSGYIEDRITGASRQTCTLTPLLGPLALGAGVRLSGFFELSRAGGGFSVSAGVGRITPLPIGDIVKEVGYGRRDPACPQVKPMLIELLRPEDPPGPGPAPPVVPPVPPPVGPVGPPPTGPSAPTGRTSGDPILMRWFHPKGIYPDPIRVGGSNYAMTTTGQPLPAPDTHYRIGVAYIPGVRGRLRKSKTTSDSERRRFRRLLEKYGYTFPKEAVDHVQDREFAGADDPHNLWPLNSRLNSQAGTKQNRHQPVEFSDHAGDPPETVRIGDRRLRRRYFKIYVIKNPGDPY